MMHGLANTKYIPYLTVNLCPRMSQDNIPGHKSQINTTINKTGNACINATLRSIHATIVAVEKQELLHILSVCL